MRGIVVDDSPTMREMLTVLLQSAPDIDVIGEDAVLKKPDLDDPETCENVVNTVRLMARALVIHLEQGLVRHV